MVHRTWQRYPQQRSCSNCCRSETRTVCALDPSTALWEAASVDAQTCADPRYGGLVSSMRSANTRALRGRCVQKLVCAGWLHARTGDFARRCVAYGGVLPIPTTEGQPQFAPRPSGFSSEVGALPPDAAVSHVFAASVGTPPRPSEYGRASVHRDGPTRPDARARTGGMASQNPNRGHSRHACRDGDPGRTCPEFPHALQHSLFKLCRCFG